MHTTTNKDNTHRFEGLHFHHQQQGKHPQIWRPSLPPPTTRITPIGLKAFTSITNNKEYTHRFEGLHFHHQQQGIHPQVWRPSLPSPTTRNTPTGLKAFTSITNNKEYTHQIWKAFPSDQPADNVLWATKCPHQSKPGYVLFPWWMNIDILHGEWGLVCMKVSELECGIFRCQITGSMPLDFITD